MSKGKKNNKYNKRGGNQGGYVGDNFSQVSNERSSSGQNSGHSGRQNGKPSGAENNYSHSRPDNWKGMGNHSQPWINNRRGRGNYSHPSTNFDRGSENYSQKEGHSPQKSSSDNPQEQLEDTEDISPELLSLLTLSCLNCDKTYNDSERQPMVLWCGHTVCKTCLQTLIRHTPKCSVCGIGFKKDIRHVDDACVNFALLSAVSENTKAGKELEKSTSENTSGSDSFQNIDNRDALKCKGCFKFYNTSSKLPRILDCGHTFCTLCIQHQIKKAGKCLSCDMLLEWRNEPIILNKLLCDIVRTMELNSAHKKKNENIAKIDESHEAIANAEKPIDATAQQADIAIAEKPIVDATAQQADIAIAEKPIVDATAQQADIAIAEKPIVDATAQQGDIAIAEKPIVCAVAPTDHSSDYDVGMNNLALSPKKSPQSNTFSVNGVHQRHQENKSDDMVSHAAKPPVDQIDQFSIKVNLEHDKASTPDKSPHDSNCLKNAVHATLHCPTCQKWVCDECGRIDHPQLKGCHLIPKKIALGQMKDTQVKGAEALVESLDNTTGDLHVYMEQLEAFSLTMQAAFEYITKEKARVEMTMKNCSARKGDVEAALSSLGKAQNLPGALSALQNLEGLSKDSQQWITSEASKTLDHRRVVQTTREILLSSVQMRILSEQENNAALMLLASQKVSDKNLLSRMTVEGGRIFVHSLEKIDSVPHGARAIPLTSIKACLDPASALAFLDIGWNGNVKGRVTIRIMGDTIRGRQFFMMCTGEAGSSYRNSVFHRVWWKGKPAEHIWGGDYSNRDGSGGAPVLKVSDKEKSSLLAGRPLLICAGLVAGSFEKGNPSTIFRIYTKDDLKPVKKSSTYSKEVEEVEDNSAFGRVEYGLHFLDEAVKQSNISDVTIYECGVVIET